MKKLSEKQKQAAMKVWLSAGGPWQDALERAILAALAIPDEPPPGHKAVEVRTGWSYEIGGGYEVRGYSGIGDAQMVYLAVELQGGANHCDASGIARFTIHVPEQPAVVEGEVVDGD